MALLDRDLLDHGDEFRDEIRKVFHDLVAVFDGRVYELLIEKDERTTTDLMITVIKKRGDGLDKVSQLENLLDLVEGIIVGSNKVPKEGMRDLA